MAQSRIQSFTDENDFLSNFYPLPKPIIDDMGIKYPTVEHAYQASKSLNPADRLRISLLATPNEAKKEGNKVELRDNWDIIKYPIMMDFVWQKYKFKALRKKLLQTGDAILLEGNHWHDIDYGVCTCKLHKGVGKNNLGKITMLVRELAYQEERARHVTKRLGLDTLLGHEVWRFPRIR